MSPLELVMETNFSRLTGITDPAVLADMAAIRVRMGKALAVKDIAAYHRLGAEHRALMAQHAPDVAAHAAACRADD